MPDFVQLWVYLSTAPLFGLTATLVVYVVAAADLRPGRARALGQPGALVGDRPRRDAARHRHAVPDLLRRRPVRPRAARAGGGGAGLAAVAAPRRAAPAQRRPARRRAGRRHRRRRQRGAARGAARPARRGGALARLEVGDRAGGHGHRRAHRRRAGAGRGLRRAHRPGRRALGQVPVQRPRHRQLGGARLRPRHHFARHRRGPGAAGARRRRRLRGNRPRSASPSGLADDSRSCSDGSPELSRRSRPCRSRSTTP